jgi:hypothetical protein
MSAILSTRAAKAAAAKACRKMNTPLIVPPETLALAGQWMHYAFDSDLEGANGDIDVKTIKYHLKNAIKVMDHSGLAPMLKQWRIKEQKSHAGRRALLTPTHLIPLMMAHMQAGRGLNHRTIGITLAKEFTVQDFLNLRLTNDRASARTWEHRVFRAVRALHVFVDSTPGQRWKRPGEGEYAKILAARDPDDCDVKAARMNELANMLIHGSNLIAPEDLFKDWKGNIAFDATFLSTMGKRHNPSRKDLRNAAKARANISYDMGEFWHGGNHNGDIGKDVIDSKIGMELELGVRIPNRPGEIANFPLTVIAIHHHRPGEVNEAAITMLESMAPHKYEKGLLLSDRLYTSGMKEKNFHRPALMHGYELVADLKSNQLSIQETHEDIIMVGGHWYLARMPDKLIYAERDFNDVLKATTWNSKTHHTIRAENLQKRHYAAQTAKARITAREKFRLTRKGVRNKLDSQRFLYPPIAAAPYVDKITAEVMPGQPMKSISIPAELGLKFAQRFAHGSPDWVEHYGMRSIIESYNAFIKEGGHEDIDNAQKRRPRGNTFQYLAGVMAVVSANLRKIHAFLIRMGNGRIREIKPRKYRHPLEYWELGTMPYVESENDFDTDEDGSDPPPG